jgi:hypothetical protein
LFLQLEKKFDAGSEAPASNLSRREEKAPARDGESVFSHSNNSGAKQHNLLPNNVVLGEPKTEGMGEASEVSIHPANGGEAVESVTQAPHSEHATGTGEAASSSHNSSVEPSTDIYVPTAPESNAPQETKASGGLLSKFTEKFT